MERPGGLDSRKRFFDDYCRAFHLLADDLNRQCAGQPWTRDYAMQLLNRCALLCFIQGGGLLGGDRDFLRSTWRSYRNRKTRKDTFVAKWLNIVFFRLHSGKSPRAARRFPEEIRRVLLSAPSINVGLFRENELDRKGLEAGIAISDERFEQVLAFLEQYDFTVVEDSLRDQETAVDPEMIGKVCEGLVNEGSDRRRDAGVFYTPQTEIDLMCRLAMVDHLANHLGPSSKDLLYRLVLSLKQEEQAVADHEAAAAGVWPRVGRLLRDVAVLDPACGSGSFLVGMLRMLDNLQERANRQLGVEERTCDRKRRIIERSLYGVEMMDWACHVAEMRLWLSLLPHADRAWEGSQRPCSFNICCADCLAEEISTGREISRGLSQFSLHENETVPFRNVKRRNEALAGASSWHARLGSDRCGFDIVIGNPPYVRKEQIRDPRQDRQGTTAEDRRKYKERIAARIYRAYPRFFGYREAAGARKINAHSDLYVYFFFVGLSLLDEKGSFCFLTSNSWLDAGYGADLQEFLLTSCHVKMIIDNSAQRSFADAGVNTAIVLASSAVAEKRPSDCTVRFVSFSVPFERVLSPSLFQAIECSTSRRATNEYRVHPIGQAELLEDGREAGSGGPPVVQKVAPRRRHAAASRPYLGNKWGGKFLRAPDIYWTIVEKGAGRLVRLSSLCAVEGYIHDNNTGGTFPQVPFIKSVKNADRIALTLESGGVVRYGVKPEGNSRTWAPLLFPRTFGSRHLVLWNRDRVHGKEFYKVIPQDEAEVISIAAQLNSTFGLLQRELIGLVNFGDGAIKFSAEDVKLFLVLPEFGTDQLRRAFFQLASRPAADISTELEQPDRRAVDSLFFDALGLSQSQRDEVCHAAICLMEGRLQKAKSLR